MDNRLNAAERFIDERQDEAIRAVTRARLQQEAARAAGEANGRAGALVWLAQALRRALNHPLRSDSWRAFQRDAAQPVPARVEVRRL